MSAIADKTDEREPKVIANATIIFVEWPMFRESQRDLHFTSVLDVSGWMNVAGGIATVELKHVAESFTENFRRAMHPSYFVIDSISWAGWLASASTEAQAIVARNQVGPNDVHEAFQKEVERLVGERMLQYSLDSAAQTQWAKDLCDSFFGRFSRINHGLELTLAAMLINAWTAFESLATDLWVTALNERPKPLAVAAITEQKSDASDQKPEDKRSETQKFILACIEGDENIEAGNLLRRQGKFDFDRYEGIKDAYRCAFGRGSVTALLKGNCFLDLIVLDSVRNALVHESGRVDRMFLSRVKRNQGLFEKYGMSEMELGQRLPIDGDLVKELLDASVKASAGLLSLVDTWFVANP